MEYLKKQVLHLLFSKMMATRFDMLMNRLKTGFCEQEEKLPHFL